MVGGYLILDDDRFTFEVDESEKIITDKQLADVLYNNEKPVFFKTRMITSRDLENGTYRYIDFNGWLSKHCSNTRDAGVGYIAQVGASEASLSIDGDTITFKVYV